MRSSCKKETTTDLCELNFFLFLMRGYGRDICTIFLCDGDEVGSQPRVDSVGHGESLGTFVRLGNVLKVLFVYPVAFIVVVVVLFVVFVVALNLSLSFLLYKNLYIATLSAHPHPTSPPFWRLSLFFLMSFSFGGLALLSLRRPFADSLRLILLKTDIRSFFCLVIFSIVVLVLGIQSLFHPTTLLFNLLSFI